MLNEVLLQAKKLGFKCIVVGNNRSDVPAVMLTKFTPRKTHMPELYCERSTDVMELHLGQDKLLDVIRELQYPSIHKIDDLVIEAPEHFMPLLIRHKPTVLRARYCRDKEPILSLNGLIWTNPGDYVIEGVNGELYPCDPEIFKKLYDVRGD